MTNFFAACAGRVGRAISNSITSGMSTLAVAAAHARAAARACVTTVAARCLDTLSAVGVAGGLVTLAVGVSTDNSALMWAGGTTTLASAACLAFFLTAGRPPQDPNDPA